MKKTFQMQDIECANCAAQMEASIAKIEGVSSVHINFLRQTMVLDAAEAQFDEIVEKIKKAIRKIEPDVRLK